MFIIEAGKNHFGKLDEAQIIMDFFYKSSFNKITFMCHTKNWYETQNKTGLNFKLPKKFYSDAIKKCKKLKKKIGLSVCDEHTYNELSHLDFDFFKLLSISVNNFNLIEKIDCKKKKIYISTGFRVTYEEINKCIKCIKSSPVEILHTPMTDEYQNLNLRKIEVLRKRFKLKVGYSNHFFDKNILNVISAYKPSVIMLYIKQLNRTGRVYPDNDHAFFIEELENMKKQYLKFLKSHDSIDKEKKINIFKEIKF